MSTYTNIIEIYQTLYKLSDSLPNGELQDGYDECLFNFMIHFKNLSNINLHLENYRLKKINQELLLLVDRCESRIDNAIAENSDLKKQIKAFTMLPVKQSLTKPHNLIELYYSGYKVNFYSHTSQEIFDNHFQEAKQHVLSRIIKKKIPKNSTIKQMMIEFYRSKGFKVKVK